MQQSRQCNYIIIIVNSNIIIIFSILFYIFLLGLHSFTIVMLKQATLVFLWMAWKTTTSFRWIWRNTLPCNGNIFCVSSSLCLCVFYWFNLCTLECPKCTIHVLSFLISIKNILLIIQSLKDVLCCTLFYVASHRRCVFTHFSLWSMWGPFVKSFYINYIICTV